MTRYLISVIPEGPPKVRVDPIPNYPESVAVYIDDVTLHLGRDFADQFVSDLVVGFAEVGE